MEWYVIISLFLLLIIHSHHLKRVDNECANLKTRLKTLEEDMYTDDGKLKEYKDQSKPL